MANSQSNNALMFMMLTLIFLLCTINLGFGVIRYSIPEELEYSTFVGNIAEDLGLNVRQLSVRRCRLVAVDGRQYLEVNLESGVLYVNEIIDREQLCAQSPTCILAFQIIIENPLEMYRGEVEIVDVNDNSPSFQESAILLQMAESIAPGSRFPLESALDPDAGTNTVTTYNISPNEHFGLKVKTREDNTKIAELLLEKPLDRERQSSFHLVLTAIDGGTPHRSGTIQITINLLDINDNAPVFEHEIYRASVVENAPPGTLVIKIKAVDLDQGTNAELKYSFINLVSRRVRELFSLDPETGEIRVQEPLDFEEANSYELDVQAVDNGSPAIAGHSKVLIKLIDMNDNAPEIKLTSLSSNVREDAVRGTVIAFFEVMDRDSGANGQIHCQIPKEIPFKLQSSLNYHYKLITNGLLDREAISVYNIPILAWDSGSPPLASNKTIRISVSDVNDNAPQFARPAYTVYVMENNAPGAAIFAVTAFDPDLDQNSYITYSLTGNLQDSPVSTYLNINSMNGTIYALRSFDYEQLKNFQVQVQARDAGVPPLSSSATLNVIILDQNDNAPIIVSPSAQSGSAAEAIVPQSAGQGYIVTKIIATDADSGQNARLFYQMVQATNPTLFTVVSNSGEIRTTRGILDEDGTTQSLVILVRDNGQPSLSGTATILLSILANVSEKISENSNLISNPGYSSDLNLYLIIAFGSTSFIFLVTIVLLVGVKCKQDRDSVPGHWSPLCCCRQRNSKDAFTRTAAPIDSLNYSGTGQDIPFPETYGCTVCLSPESSKSEFLFLKPYNPHLPQGSLSKDSIIFPTSDINLSSNNALKFMVLVFIFLICALDVVSGQIRYSVPEELEQGTGIGNIAEDLGLNIRKLLARKGRLVSDYTKRYLELNLENGMLFANERIDRDQLCGTIPTCVLSFQIVIENSPEIYRGEVEVLDVNDNSPSFPESAMLLQMGESIARGSRFPLESALDPDMGTNTVTTYSISPNEHFGLKVQTADDGTKTAELLLEKPLDRERESSFQLVLTATDGGSPPRSGSARIIITVLDSNDNAPAFDRELYKVSLLENSPRGTLVVTVHATDPDEGPNAEVTYSFSNRVSQKVQKIFSLDQQTGEIRVQGLLDFEEVSSYSLDVQAVDNGSPAIAGHSKVLIKVIDVNDNAPEIKVTLVSRMVPEDAGRGTVIALINIIDRDSGENGQVHCQIPLDVPFKLQTSLSNHYKLIISGLLDRETAPLYNVPILAWDSGSPPLSTNKTIQISISDVNDNSPRFDRLRYTVYVMENNAPGASIFTVTALDPDLDQNSYVSYSFIENLLQNSPVPTYLNINSMNGTIYALRSFDYERLKNFQIQVQARDAGIPPLSSSTTLNVIILDQNDNAPVIVSPSAQSDSASLAIVPQSAGRGYLVTKIIATDADSGQNARLFYQVLKATDPSLFNVGLNSGEIRTARGILEQDATTTQTLVIMVKDNGQPSLSSTVTIRSSILGNVTERFSESSNLVTNPEYVSDVNLYLIVILGSTSFIFLVAIILLIGIKCKQDRNITEDYTSPSCCYRPGDSNDAFNPIPAPKESLNCTAASEIIRIPETHHYAVCLSPESAKSDFLFLKPYTPPMSQAQC
ncbi:protocadherin alpha-C2-like [Heterodontus francisci]|uniref:protocadherin alpha-C2-like n=1 Tax=Heterodontus francisci TaxID=7792 RepID=UPI00355C4A64